MAKKRRYHTCRKRQGSPRFSPTCKKEFRECLRGELKETGSLRSAGTTCMTALHQCQAGRGHAHAMRRRGKRR
jgi:hypothetical protein